MIEMEIDSIRVSKLNGEPVITLKEKGLDRYLAIWIESVGADAIERARRNVRAERPTTHDVMTSIIVSLGASIDHVLISALKRDAFHAKIALRLNDRQAEVDTRPSDALALAVRTGTPIYAEESVLDKAGITLEDGSEASRDFAAFLGKYESAYDGIRREVPRHHDGTYAKAHEVFSEAALGLLQEAQKAAKDMHSSAVEPLHILLAILESSHKHTTEMLRAFNVPSKEACARLKQLGALTQESTDTNAVELGEGGRRLLSVAIDEAQMLGGPAVAPEHLLLAALRESSQATLEALRPSTIPLEEAYRALAASYF